jgi:hypothetical protein
MLSDLGKSEFVLIKLTSYKPKINVTVRYLTAFVCQHQLELGEYNLELASHNPPNCENRGHLPSTPALGHSDSR